MADELKVGGELDAWCTSCRLMKWHTIVALVGGRPAKVECQGCGKQHQFRAHPPGTKGEASERASRPRTTTQRPIASAAPSVSFDALLGGRAHTAAPYAPNRRYALEELLEHPSFGTGVVTGLFAAQKIEVTFREGKKILLHDRGAQAPSRLDPPRRVLDETPQVGTSDSPRGLK